MQVPIPVGPNPSLPSPVGPLSGLAGLSGGGGVGSVLSADASMSGAVLASIFGPIAAAAGKWILQAGIFISSQAVPAGGVTFEVISAGASGLFGSLTPTTSAAQSANQVVTPGNVFNSLALVNFDVSNAANFVFASLVAGLITTGSSIDLQWKNVTGGNTYTVKAGSWILLTKVG